MEILINPMLMGPTRVETKSKKDLKKKSYVSRQTQEMNKQK